MRPDDRPCGAVRVAVCGFTVLCTVADVAVQERTCLCACVRIRAYTHTRARSRCPPTSSLQLRENKRAHPACRLRAPYAPPLCPAPPPLLLHLSPPSSAALLSWHGRSAIMAQHLLLPALLFTAPSACVAIHSTFCRGDAEAASL
eukprot:1999462-Rhodomonas_salina.1